MSEEEEEVYESFESNEFEEEDEGELEESPVSEERTSPTSDYVRSSSLKLSEWDNDLPDGYSLRIVDLLRDPEEDDFAKRLVREGRLGIEDVYEIIDEEGHIVGSKVLPHAKEAYLEEVALYEAEQREKSSSIVSGITDYDSQNPDDLDDSEEKLEEQQTNTDRSFGLLRHPRTVESLYNLIEPTREDEFKEQVENLNKQIGDTQHRICFEHKMRKVKKVKRFQLERKLILNAVTELGVLYLPGNFLDPIVGRRIEDADLPFILETLKEIPESQFTGFNLAYNSITDEGISILAPFIQERPSIAHLNFSHNDFTANGLYTLVTFLISRRSLQTLKISGVKVGDQGINSITCLYMCGKGPRDLDVSETDMTMPGFQALCSAFQAVDEDQDYPKFLTMYKLPFSLETLARLKLENHEFIKSQTYHRLCHSHFELVPPKEKDRRLQEINQKYQEENIDLTKTAKSTMKDALAPLLEDAIPPVILGGGDSRECLDLIEVAQLSRPIHERSVALPEVDEIIGEYKFIHDKGCKQEENGRPVIVCPSLYSLDVDEFMDEEDSDSENREKLKAKKAFRHANPLYMDELVEAASLSAGHEMLQDNKDREVADTLTAQKASVKFIREAIAEAGGLAGVTEFTQQSDMAQVLFQTILENAKRFLQTDTEEGGANQDLTEPELRMIWEHSLKITHKIFRPSVPAHCKITDDIMEVFVEEFMKISCGTFYKLIQVPFFQELFEKAATKGCIETSHSKQKAKSEYISAPLDLSYNECVRDVVLKFLETVIVKAADIISVGDPYNIRQKNGRSSEGEQIWPSIMDITEEQVEPLVDKMFEAGALLAQDALSFKEEDQTNQDEGIEPAKQYLEGIFKQLTNFLYQIKDDDQKLNERLEKPAKKFTFSTKPVRLVLNRPFFNNYEPVMASKLGAYLENNDSVQCLHIRKWGLEEDGMMNLMEKILYNTNIVTLDLTCNGIGSEGMKAMGLYLLNNQNLKHLLLSHNRLRNPGIQIITDVLPQSSLISINVAYNDITDVGLDPFLEAVGNSKIYSLYILGNCFSQTTCNLINELFESDSLYRNDCDVSVQEVDGEMVLMRNSQARDINEWYEVPAPVDIGLFCPPYYLEQYTPPKVTIFGAVDVEV